MLVLSRKVSEAILIGPDVRVTILKVERNQVRIGIEAPGSVTILRGELVDEDRKVLAAAAAAATE